MKRKILILFAITFLVCLLIVPAFATEWSTHGTGDNDWGLSNNGGFGTTAIQGNNETLWYVKFPSKHAVGAQTGSASCKVYLHNASGVYLEETSTTTINLGLTTTDYANYTFYFSNATFLFDTEYYFVAFIVGSLAVQQYVHCDQEGGSSHTSADGGTSWTNSGTQTPVYYAYTVASGGGESLWVPTDYDELISRFVTFFVPILVILLPAALLCFATRRVDKWLILIGLTIGAGLGYYFSMVPLWLVFLVVIGLIGMAYQSVRGGG